MLNLHENEGWIVQKKISSRKHLLAGAFTGDLHIDNNACENAIRPFVIGRKAWLFSDTTHGAEASALIYSLIETAKANGHEPHSWLNHVMRELPKARDMKSYDHLLPWNLNADDLIRNAYTAEAPT